jgi:hypothetical protein
MSTMISRGKELIRISPKDARKIEYSTTSGRTWILRNGGSYIQGEFQDLTDNGKEILGMTSKGLFYSTTDGRTWIRRSS